MHKYFINGRVFTGETILEGFSVEVRDGKVVSVARGVTEPEGAEVIDLGGNLLVPGFVDVQVNGGGGALFNATPDVDTLETIAKAHRQYGTTSMLPTLVSDEWEVMESAAQAVRDAISQGVPGIRGIHFEGPYLSRQRKGIHREEFLREVDPDAFALLTGEGLGVVITTVAPEVVGSDYIRDLTQAGIKVCAGHTAATYNETRVGLEAGIVGFTHLFNAMTPMTSREPGVVGAALEDLESWVGIIADGHHIHFASVEVAVAAKPKGKTMLVTDAMPSVGAEEKNFTLQGQPIIAEDGRCQAASGTLAGSDLDMMTAVRNCVKHIGLDLKEALRMGSLYPASFLGLGHSLGRIQPGYEADFALLDDELNVTQTWIAGS